MGLVSSHLNFIQTKTMTTCQGSYEEAKPEAWGGFHWFPPLCTLNQNEPSVFTSFMVILSLGVSILKLLQSVKLSCIIMYVSVSHLRFWASVASARRSLVQRTGNCLQSCTISPLINSASSNTSSRMSDAWMKITLCQQSVWWLLAFVSPCWLVVFYRPILSKETQLEQLTYLPHLSVSFWPWRTNYGS